MSSRALVLAMMARSVESLTVKNREPPYANATPPARFPSPGAPDIAGRPSSGPKRQTKNKPMTQWLFPPRPTPSLPIVGRDARFPRAPHPVRGPELRRPCARDGIGPGQADALLLLQARRRPGVGRRRPGLSVGDGESALRGRTGRRPRPDAGWPDRRGRLGGRLRPDPPRPAGRGQEDRPALGRRQGVRPVRAVRPPSPWAPCPIPPAPSA